MVFQQEQRKLDEQNAEVIRIEDEYAKLHAEIERQMEIREEVRSDLIILNQGNNVIKLNKKSFPCFIYFFVHILAISVEYKN